LDKGNFNCYLCKIALSKMKTLKVILCKANKGVSAHLPEIDGYVIARETVEKLKRDLAISLSFHIEGLYEEERQPWMNEPFDFDFVFQDIPTMIEGFSGLINQSSLARISGINESQMRLKKYADELRNISFV